MNDGEMKKNFEDTPQKVLPRMPEQCFEAAKEAGLTKVFIMGMTDEGVASVLSSEMTLIEMSYLNKVASAWLGKKVLGEI